MHLKKIPHPFNPENKDATPKYIRDYAFYSAILNRVVVLTNLHKSSRLQDLL